MIAICMIRELPHYRRDAFVNGLKRAGYSIVDKGRPADKRDVLVIWNRYGPFEAMANRWEEQGGSVLVAENGYIGRDANDHQLYALAVHGHNGSGWWPRGDGGRFAALGIDVAPWVNRPEGYALICGQRGIGSREMASPPNWHDKVAQSWAGPVKIRRHPGNKPDPNAPKLVDDLAGAKCCVVWSSSSGVRALTLGIPVFFDAPHWICEDAAVPVRRPDDFEMPSPELLEDLRTVALERMAWAQWSIAELETGDPFARILDGIGEATW